MTRQPPVRLVIADDHPMFRYGLTAALAKTDEIEVVGEAASGTELLAVVERTTPDVVLTDLAMHEDDAALFGALRAGAHGYLLKGADRADIVRAVLSIAAGDAVYGHAV